MRSNARLPGVLLRSAPRALPHALAAALVLMAALRITAARAATVDTVFVVPGAHLDIGYTDMPSKVIEQRIATLDAALDAAAADSAFRWVEEGGFVFDRWWRRNAGRPDRIALARRALARGQLGVGATWVSPHAAAVPEALSLLTLHIASLAHDFAYRPPVAIVNDTPSQPEALVDVLAAAGVRYLLMGANMFLTRPLPPQLVRSPFWWESARGARVLVSIDPAGYLPAAAWPDDADTSEFTDPRRFPHDRHSLAMLRAGMRSLIAGSDPRYEVLVMQHAFDNGDARDAMALPRLLSEWNAAGLSPRIVASTGVEYFRHVERVYGRRLPVVRGEWGGQWDYIRAASPVWTWRLRRAARAAVARGSRDARAAVATAIDHDVVLGTVRPGMTIEQYRGHAADCAAIYREAVERALGRDAVRALPPTPAPPPAGPRPAAWDGVLARGLTPRVRAGPEGPDPFVGPGPPALEAPVSEGGDDARYSVVARVDRTALPGTHDGIVCSVIELPLDAAAADLHLAPLDSPAALAGRWLRGEAPTMIVAARGLRVSTDRWAFELHSELIECWTLVADGGRPGVTWLQGLVSRETDRCQVARDRAEFLPFDQLYPGEPPVLDIAVELTRSDRSRAK